jgi:prevent-host-death family protein
MITMTASEAKKRVGELLDNVQRQPVRVMRRNRLAGVVISAKDYEAMRAFYANRLEHTLDEAATAAVRAGLTEAEVDALIRPDYPGNGQT